MNNLEEKDEHPIETKVVGSKLIITISLVKVRQWLYLIDIRSSFFNTVIKTLFTEIKFALLQAPPATLTEILYNQRMEKYDLEKLRLPVLHNIAEGVGVDINGRSKEDIITAILKKQHEFSNPKLK